jgi:hypothetical protein
MLNVGDQPGIVSTELGQALRVDTSHYAPAPVIVRVHTHDPAGMDCTLDYVTACEHVMVDEAYLWSGDEATASHPTSAAQAAAAFGVSAITTTSPPCEGSGFPGIPVLALPGSLPANSATSPIDPIWATGQGVIAIFPSAQALAAAAPDAAAHGESDIPPIDPNLSFISSSSHFVCDDIINGVSYKTHWLARGNVLLAVEYDSNLGVAADPFVKEARQKLQTLPAS